MTRGCPDHDVGQVDGIGSSVKHLHSRKVDAVLTELGVPLAPMATVVRDCCLRERAQQVAVLLCLVFSGGVFSARGLEARHHKNAFTPACSNAS